MGYAGTSFEAYVKEEGIEDEVNKLAYARLRAVALEQEKELYGLTNEDLSQRLEIDLSQVKHLVASEDGKVSQDSRNVVDAYLLGRAKSRRQGQTLT